jgi:NADPH:quinone reductase-like Zn-dependent oxidoreductase
LLHALVHAGEAAAGAHPVTGRLLGADIALVYAPTAVAVWAALLSRSEAHRSSLAGIERTVRMRIVVAGASGVVGKALVPALVARGHKVLGVIRSAAGASIVARTGAKPALVDALNQPVVLEEFRRFRPDAIVPQLTALAATTDHRDFVRDFDKAFERTNLLRTRGTDNLLARGGERRDGGAALPAQHLA